MVVASEGDFPLWLRLMTRIAAFLCFALASTGCYTLKGPATKRPPMSAAQQLQVDSTRRAPEGETYKRNQPQGLGPHSELKEGTIQGGNH